MELQLIFHGAEVEVQMDQALQNFLSESFVDKAVTEGLQATAGAVRDEIQENFEAGGRPSWGTDLVETGALRDSATTGLQFSQLEDELEAATDPAVEYAEVVNSKKPFMVVPDGQPMDNVAAAFLRGATAEIKE